MDLFQEVIGWIVLIALGYFIWEFKIKPKRRNRKPIDGEFKVIE